MRRQKSDFELLAPKMRQPIHITYLAKYILKKTLKETQEVIDRGVEQGSIRGSQSSMVTTN